MASMSVSKRGGMRSTRALRVALVAAVAAMLVSAPSPSAYGRSVSGRGQLSGKGTGTARLEGSGTFYLRGSGTLTVRDPGNGTEIELHGFAYSTSLSCGFRIYRGSGWIRVSGSDAMVKLDGEVEEISARGDGACYLRGEGRYRVGSRVRSWRERGLYLRFDLTG